MRVLIIDNEAKRLPTGKLVADRNTPLLIALKVHGVDHAADVAIDELDLEAHIESYHYSAVLVHWHVGVITTVAKLRRMHKSLTIIVLADHLVMAQLRACLNSGADDYLVTPFAMVELLARIDACVRRHAGYAQSLVECGCITLDLYKRAWIVNGAPRHLPRSEYRVLEALVLANGRPVPKDEMLYMLHGVNGGQKDAKVVDVFIHHLRRTFRKNGVPARAIGTCWGRGWCIDMNIELPHVKVADAA